MPSCVECRKVKVVRKAFFNDADKTVGQFCSEHKLAGMINVVKKRELLTYSDVNPSELFQHPKLKDFYAHPSGKLYKREGTLFYEIAKNKHAITGRHTCCLKINKKGTHFFRYRLVWECCSQQEIPPKFEVDHIDGDCTNDAFDNLQILSRPEHNKKTHSNHK